MNDSHFLPTDKNGQVYYGPTTYAQAVAQIREGRDWAEMARMLDQAGYTGIAAKIRKQWHDQLTYDHQR